MEISFRVGCFVNVVVGIETRMRIVQEEPVKVTMISREFVADTQLFFCFNNEKQLNLSTFWVVVGLLQAHKFPQLPKTLIIGYRMCRILRNTDGPFLTLVIYRNYISFHMVELAV